MSKSEARELRKNMTEVERTLWKHLRFRQLEGQKFRRQQPVGLYIVDFVCFEKRLIIEVDGGQHAEQFAYDSERSAWLEKQGFRILRFWNNEVLTETETIKEVIREALICEVDPPHLNPPPQGGRRSNGAIMLVTLLFLLLLTILGTSSLYLAYTEIVLVKSVESDARAFYIAESGTAQVLYWFNDPEQFTGVPEDFFRRRRIDNTSFFDEDGTSQYSGTGETPDLLYTTMDNGLKIFGPVSPGALCTVESTGISGRIRRTITVELFEDLSGVKALRGSWRVD